MIEDLLKIVLKSISHRKVRSWLTVVGIIIGIAAIVTLISVSEGLELAIQEQFEKFGATTIRVTPKGLRGPPTDTDKLTKEDVEVVEKIKGIDYVAPIILKNVKVEFNSKEEFILVAGYPADKAKVGFSDLNLVIKEGRVFEEKDSKIAIVGSSIAEGLFDKSINIKNNIKINGEKYRIIGILKRQGVPNTDQGIYITLEDARENFNDPEGLSIVTAKVQSGIDVSTVRSSIERKLEKSRGNENFDVFTPEQIMEQLATILFVVQFVLVGIATISLFVGAIGIMNSMFTAVLERTKDIGIMKAVGARNSTILLIFILEAGIFGLVGGIIGVIIGITSSFLVEFIAKELGFELLKITINSLLVIGTTIFSFVIGMISGYIPARRASNLRPVDALRYE